MSRPITTTIRVARKLVAVLTVTFVALGLTATPAAAHTGFESSSPSDQDVVDDPVGEILIVFSGEATPAGEGFIALDADGNLRSPDAAISDDNLTWVLTFNEPLAGGQVGVRWTVQAPDAHPIDGSFSFTVTADASADEVGAAAPSTIEASPTPTTIPAASASSEPTIPPAATSNLDAGASDTAAAGVPTAAQSLEEFLTEDNQSAAGANGISVIGRILSLSGAAIGIGGLLFAAVVLRGHRRDIYSVLFWVQRAGVLLAVGSAIELIAQIAVTGGRWSALWSTSAIGDVVGVSFGAAVGLRLFGGIALAVGAQLDVAHAETKPDPIVTIQEFVGVGAGGPSSPPSATGDSSAHSGFPWSHPDDQAWHFAASAAAFGGAIIVLLSFLFDGHTVTEGARWFHAVVNVVHVAAGSIWAGGLLMLAHVIWRRHRLGVELRALQLAARFSVVAALALVAAGVAGTVLAVIVLDSVSELWSTPWGQLLIAKAAVVVVAALAGGYNHKVLIPAMAGAPDDPSLHNHFRNVVTVEAAALALVIVFTAFLVGAAS